jgi:hypothetical protein
MNRLKRLREAEVSISLDTLSRELLETGGYEQPVRDFAVSGRRRTRRSSPRRITGSDRSLDDAGAEAPSAQPLELMPGGVVSRAGSRASWSSGEVAPPVP